MTHMGHAFASTCAAIISRSAGDAHADALALRCRSIRWARRCGWRSKRPWCAALLYRRGWFCLLSRCMHTRKVHVLVFVAHRPCILILFRLISEESYELVSSPVLSNRTSNSTTVRIMTPSVYRSALRWTLCDRSSFGVGTERSCRPGHGPSCSSPWRRTRGTVSETCGAIPIGVCCSVLFLNSDRTRHPPHTLVSRCSGSVRLSAP